MFLLGRQWRTMEVRFGNFYWGVFGNHLTVSNVLRLFETSSEIGCGSNERIDLLFVARFLRNYDNGIVIVFWG